MTFDDKTIQLEETLNEARRVWQDAEVELDKALDELNDAELALSRHLLSDPQEDPPESFP